MEAAAAAAKPLGMDTHRPFALILGGSGRLAGLLRQAWATAPPPLPIVWQSRRAAPGPDWRRVDPLADPGGLARAMDGAAAVLDLTGRTRGTDAELAVNAALARATLRAAAGRPVLLASSAAVYGPVEGLAREDMAPAPVSAYGHAKAALEAVAETDPAATCLRIGNVAGADALLGPAPRTGIVLDRFPDGATPMRSYIGPAGFAAVIAALLDRAVRGAALPAVLNLAAPGSVAMGDLLDAAGLPWTPRPAGPGAIRRVVFDTARLEAVHAFRAGAGTAPAIAAEWRAATGAP